MKRATLSNKYYIIFLQRPLFLNRGKLSFGFLLACLFKKLKESAAIITLNEQSDILP